MKICGIKFAGQLQVRLLTIINQFYRVESATRYSYMFRNIQMSEFLMLMNSVICYDSGFYIFISTLFIYDL